MKESDYQNQDAAELPRRSVHCRAGLFARHRVVRFALASACGLALRDRFSRQKAVPESKE
jgi:hypothetical protein